VLGIDHTPWPRPDAKTLKDRTYEHQGKTQNGVAIGQGYSTIAWLPDEHISWALPLRHERITSWESPITKAAWQLWLAKDLVTQYRLPWQSVTLNLSPGCVAQSMFSLSIQIGTPASAPKQRGKSNGRIIVFKCTPRIRYPVSKKTYSKPKKQQQTA
jgi:hypothetical protein